MTPQRANTWADYFDHLSNRMELRGWRYKVLGDASMDDAGASFGGIHGKDEAHICLNTEWEEYPPHIQRQYAVHELVHSHFHQFDIWLFETFRSLASPAEAERLYKTFDLMTEHAVERIAWALQEHMPLPGDVIPELAPEDEPGVTALRTRVRKKEKEKAKVEHKGQEGQQDGSGE